MNRMAPLNEVPVYGSTSMKNLFSFFALHSTPMTDLVKLGSASQK